MGRKPNVGLGPSVKRPTAPSLPGPTDGFGSIGSIIGGMRPSLPGLLPDPKPPTGQVGGNADDITFRPLPSPIGGGFVPMPFPEIGRPVVPPENKGPIGSIGSVIGGIGDGRIPLRDELQPVRPPTQPIEETRPGNDGAGSRPPVVGGGRNYKGGSPGFYGPERPDLEGIRKEDLVGGGDNRVVVPITSEDLKNRGSYKPERKVIDKSPEARQKFLDSLTREELEQRSHQDPVRGSRVQPVQEGSSRVQPVQDRRTRDFNPNLKSFDAKQYLANYGDLQKAFGDDEAKARQHFIDYGMKEGRVDTAGGGTLKAETRDRRAKTFKAKSRAAAAKRREGFLRGEEGATFDAKQYLANYADLQKAFGSDEEKARQHYRQYGAKEGRVDTRM